MNSTMTKPEEYEALAEESPIFLLEWISAGNKSEREAACTHLVERYFGPLKRKLFYPLRGLGLAGEEEDFAIRALRRALKRPEKFARETDESMEVQEMRFLKWLATIAWNLALTAAQNLPDTSVQNDDFWETVVDRSNRSEIVKTPSRPEVQAAEDALAQLTEREQTILRFYYNHCPDIENPQSKMPRKVISQLCESYQTTPDNIRTIKSRAKKKFEQIMNSKGFNK